MFLHDLRALCLRRTDQDLLRCLREAYLPLHMKLFLRPLICICTLLGLYGLKASTID
jgi:hypothetical protein